MALRIHIHGYSWLSRFIFIQLMKLVIHIHSSWAAWIFWKITVNYVLEYDVQISGEMRVKRLNIKNVDFVIWWNWKDVITTWFSLEESLLKTQHIRSFFSIVRLLGLITLGGARCLTARGPFDFFFSFYMIKFVKKTKVCAE